MHDCRVARKIDGLLGSIRGNVREIRTEDRADYLGIAADDGVKPAGRLTKDCHSRVGRACARGSRHQNERGERTHAKRRSDATTVSYTHLDVYKRQREGRTEPKGCYCLVESHALGFAGS